MRRIAVMTLLSAVAAVGLWTLYHRDQIHCPSDVIRLAVKQWQAVQSSNKTAPPPVDLPRDTNFLRIATFNLRPVPYHASEARVFPDLLEAIFRQFDVIAIQELEGDQPHCLRELVARMNQHGSAGAYALVLGDPYERDSIWKRAAFVFNSGRVHLDHAVAYSVADPDGVMVRPPLVGWFRAAQPPAEHAFTFSLVNVLVNERQPGRELAYLREIVRSVRRDGRDEDDVIVAGGFHAGDEGFEHLRRYGYEWVVSNSPTDIQQTTTTDNLLFDPKATCEYRGVGGVFNFVKHFNISLEEGVAVSRHFPVWGEFYVYEGFEQGFAVNYHDMPSAIR